MLLLLTQWCLSRYTCVSSLSQIGLFGTKRAFLDLENYDNQEVFLSKTNLILKRNNVLDAAASNIDGFFREIYVFFNSAK
jgi:hypothetical protein